MTPTEIGEIERACTRLVLEFARFNDDLDHEALADLFVEDCVFARPLDPEHPYHGRDKVHAIFRDRKPRLTRHVMTNILITVISEREAVGNSYVTMMSAPDPDEKWPREGEGIFIGSFDDIFVRTDAGWKFKSRIGNVALYQGGQVPVLPIPSIQETGAPR
ncbi:MAG TPA: nuclear transport factor 2 family protein [Sphingomonadaceae bacterium]|nr:nuclear transport factor 2 family protein [Sphingomonadaceae bacterium]